MAGTRLWIGFVIALFLLTRLLIRLVAGCDGNKKNTKCECYKMSEARALSLDNIPKDPLRVILNNCAMSDLANVAKCNSALRKATYAYITKQNLAALRSVDDKSVTT